MKKLTIILFAFALLFVAPVAIARDKSKDNSKETKVVTVPAGEVVNKDYFGFGDVVEISGTVNGDVYAFGGQVLVDGKVNGDLITGGGLVTVSGNITQDLRAGGGQVTISGEIGRNVAVGGGNVDFTDSARIRGSVLAGAGNLSLAAPVGSNVKVGAGNLTISNRIDGDVEAGVGVLRLTSKAKVGGDLTYWSDETASIDKNAVVVGDVTKKTPPEAARPTAGKAFAAFTGFNIFMKVVSVVSTLVIGLLLIAFFPKYNRETVSTLRRRPWVSLGVGFLTVVVTPIVFIILLATVVGIPLALILLALYLISLYLARIFIIFWAGSWILERTGRKVHEVWAFVSGLFVYYIVTLIPIIGGLVTLFVILFGLGAAALTKKAIYSLARKRDII
ncbi:MAG TPA: polymer-forming cytoskeletal protein [Candidatus Nanoarchaeia archaeon]